MPREGFPEIVMPEIYIGTAYPGNGPADIEKLITIPLEREINTISGIDDISSTSVEGFSNISVKFMTGISPSEALRKVKDKVDIVKSKNSFPKDLPSEPNIFELNLSELLPIMNLNLTGDFSVQELEVFAEYLKDEISNLREISSVDIGGIQEKEVEISIDKHKMESMNVSFGEIENSVKAENITISGGAMLTDNIKRTVRVIGEFRDTKDIANVIVRNKNGNAVFLKDIARVEFKEKEIEKYARYFKNPVVVIDIKKKSGENLISASKKIDEIIKKAYETYLPSKLEIIRTNDQSENIDKSTSSLENNIISGMLLVIFVLMFFLGLRNALFIGIAIPLSMLLSFMILSFLGVTLNTMVLFALVLSLGMLVDNGIVVVENIYRLMDERASNLDAANRGVGEVAMPIIASTLTTLAAFIPLAIWPGIMGEFMKYLPITIIIVLCSSLIVALVINPVFTSMFMKVEEKVIDQKKAIKKAVIFSLFGISSLVLGLFVFDSELIVLIGNVSILISIVLSTFKYLNTCTENFKNTFLPFVESKYESILRFCLKGNNAKKSLIGSILILALSVFIFIVFTPKVLFFPKNEPNICYVYIENEVGTDIEITNDITKRIEQKIIDFLKKYEDKKSGENFMVKSIISKVGEGANDLDKDKSQSIVSHRAKIIINFQDYNLRRGISSSSVMTEIHDVIGMVPGTSVFVKKDSVGPPTGAPISVAVEGDDYKEILDFSNKLKDFINKLNIPGVENLVLDIDKSKPDMQIYIDREKAQKLGLHIFKIGDNIRSSLYGKKISVFKKGDEEYDINMRFSKKYRYDQASILDQKISFEQGGRNIQVPISTVAEVKKKSDYTSIKRNNLKKVITITSSVLESYNANDIVKQIKNHIKDIDKPKGISIRFTGEQKKQEEQMEFLSKSLLIAISIIFLIIVAQFNSFFIPLIIVISVILSLIGVLLGLVLFQMDFVIIMTMIGIISLAGVVVNNAIVLVDYTNLTLSRKCQEMGIHQNMPFSVIYDSVIESGKKRLRPVLLTAITTIIGLIPLAVGMNIDFFGLFTKYEPDVYVGGDNTLFWGPMAWTIIFGLSFATFLTLVIVPAMYLIYQRISLSRTNL
ncbi:AcrB/AcrD/AcrF family membrane transporter [Ichthyobacterium seriolicida]|uniref:AcrB/AcrD/AcrF family membrane transporter n=2 Tax=Ichthyobacterium seriolicida TaxID=242600 RepID=A0A1J1DZ90_9FLAO|nr:AcrB/AcrD/AcrF family membrane transporter [Ichthyobacterium seriolicida]